jgi:curved DNA-binding protein CbpA
VSKRDYYEVLGVARDANDQTVKSAYRKLALKYHPDRNPGDAAAEEEFKLAAEAYAILSDPEKRSAYDRFGHAGVSGAGAGGFDPSAFAGFEDIFGNLGDLFGFGDMFGGRRRRGGPQRGADLRYDLEISFEESFTGTETSIQIPRRPAARRKSAGSAGGPASSGSSRDSSPSRVRARPAAAPARSSPGPVRPAAAPAASAASARLRQRFPRASRRGSAFACTARESTAPPAGRRATSTSSCTFRTMTSSIVRTTICIATSPSASPRSP